jgi:predicted O-linked N-acetylglucosamine transferase (SPINDLY family)
LAAADELFAAALRLEDAGRPHEALEQYRALLALAPQHADAWHNQGLLLARLGRLDQAEHSHREYVRLHPAQARAHADLADVLLARERYEEALRHCERAVALDPRAFLPALTAGLACSMLMRFAEAQRWFQRSRDADAAGFDRFVAMRLGTLGLDRDLDPRAIYLIREFDRLEACDWSRYRDYVRAFESLVQDGVSAPPLVFRSLALPVTLATRRRLAEGAARRVAVGAALARPAARAPRQEQRIRVGYVSPDFRTHPTGMLSSALFRLHDRGRFEVHAFSLAPADDSRWRRDVERHADRFHSLPSRPQHALDAVREASIDIVVDLAGATTGAMPELFAARVAPVQVSYLGFPGGSGAGLVDYLVCDPVCIPGDEAHGYGEALARLPQTFWICEPSPPEAPPARRAACGLPDDAVVLYAHHPGQKIFPQLFAAWAKVLHAVPQAVLWLLEDRPRTRDNLVREAAALGVPAQRLVFAPRVPYAEYRARIPLADLALDTPLYNGGATTLDALVAGVPVLTCPAPGFAGRMAASALAAAGLHELVCRDLDAYTEAAIRLASDAAQRKRLAARVAASLRSPLFDAALRTRQIEAAFEKMFERASRGEPPRSFDL